MVEETQLGEEAEDRQESDEEKKAAKAHGVAAYSGWSGVPWLAKAAEEKSDIRMSDFRRQVKW
jgi:hypothetical protein